MKIVDALERMDKEILVKLIQQIYNEFPVITSQINKAFKDAERELNSK